MLDSQTSVSACLTFGEEGCQISRRRNPSCKSLKDAAWRSCAQLHWPGLLGRPDWGLRLHRPQRALLGARLLWGPWPNPILIILHVLKKLKFDVQGDFLPVSASFLRALASSLEGKECPIVAISTDSIEAHRFLLCSVCHPIFFQGVCCHLPEGPEHPPGGGQDWGDLALLRSVWPDHPHRPPHCLHPGRPGRVDGLLHHQHQGCCWELVQYGKFDIVWPIEVGGSAEEVSRVVAACRECDASGAWSHHSKATPVSQLSKYWICRLAILQFSHLCSGVQALWHLPERQSWEGNWRQEEGEGGDDRHGRGAAHRLHQQRQSQVNQCSDHMWPQCNNISLKISVCDCWRNIIVTKTSLNLVGGIERIQRCFGKTWSVWLWVTWGTCLIPLQWAR